MKEYVRPPIGQERTENWFLRNWKWFVPLIVAISTAGTALFVGLIIFLFTFVFSLVKESDVYQEALERATADPAVQAALGTPIQAGYFVSGSLSTSGSSSGDADLSFPISGPKGKATVYLEATKSDGVWRFSRLSVERRDTRGRFNLLE